MAVESQTNQNIKIIAHRGYWKTEGAAQNSLNAIKAAVDEQADGVEIDVRLSKDGVVYLNHDVTINGFRISRSTAEDLDQVVLPSGETLARFDDFIKLVKDQPDLVLYIDVKRSWRKRRRELVTQKVIDVLKEHNLLSRAVILSFSLKTLKVVRAYEPDLEVMYLVYRSNLRMKRIAKRGIHWVGFYYPLIERYPRMVKKAHDLGMRTNVWTVNDKTKIQKFIDNGVDTLTTDHPYYL